MKKITTLFLAFLVIIFSFTAPAQSGHMKFKNIELDGSLTDFVAKLEKQGFTVLTKIEEGAALKGTFAGKDVTVLIPCKAGETIWRIGVDFEKENVWSDLKYSYNHYKELLTTKYGKGESFEFFRTPYYDGDGYEISAVRNEKCVYSTFFKTPEGVITLEIDKSCCIRISYEDEQNSSLHSQQRKQQEYDDL